MSNILFWIIPTVIYALLGFGLFFAFRNSIVISNRRPYIVFVEQGSVFIWCILCAVTLSYGPSTQTNFNCEISESLITFFCLISVSLMTSRMSYVYRYLMDKDKLSKFGLKNIARIFWDVNNNFRLVFVTFGSVLIGLLSVSNVLLFHTVNKIWYKAYLACIPWTMETVFAEYMNGLLILILLMFTFQFIRYKIKDQIGMSIELISYTLTLSSVIILYLAIVGEFDHQLIFIEGLISILY